MGFTCLAYKTTFAGAATEQDMTAVVDPEFSQRNNHYIFSEDYTLRAVYGASATLSRLSLNVPTFNAIGKFSVWPLNLTSTNVLSPPRASWFDYASPHIPVNEEVQIAATAGAAENSLAVLWPFTPNHTANLPGFKTLLSVRATSTIQQVAGSWSAAGQLAFEQSLRGGIYALVGGECVGTGTHLWRMSFPRSRLYRGRRLRPGWLAQQAVGDLPDPKFAINPFAFGEWGRFHTFEPPQVEIFSIAGAGNIAHEFRLWLAFLGEDSQMGLDSWVSQGWT